MAVEQLTDEQIEHRMDVVDGKINDPRTDPKELPTLNLIYGKLLDEQVRRDLERERLAIEHVNKMEAEKLAIDPHCYDGQKTEMVDRTAT